MKTFKDEHRELLLWYKEKTDECDKIPSEGGHDGGGTEQRRIYTEEYHKKLTDLKQKYGKLPTATQSGYVELTSSMYASGK
jgi:hypothetical protein